MAAKDGAGTSLGGLLTIRHVTATTIGPVAAAHPTACASEAEVCLAKSAGYLRGSYLGGLELQQEFLLMGSPAAELCCAHTHNTGILSTHVRTHTKHRQAGNVTTWQELSG